MNPGVLVYVRNGCCRRVPSLAKLPFPHSFSMTSSPMLLPTLATQTMCRVSLQRVKSLQAWRSIASSGSKSTHPCLTPDPVNPDCCPTGTQKARRNGATFCSLRILSLSFVGKRQLLLSSSYRARWIQQTPMLSLVVSRQSSMLDTIGMYWLRSTTCRQTWPENLGSFPALSTSQVSALSTSECYLLTPKAETVDHGPVLRHLVYGSNGAQGRK